MQKAMMTEDIINQVCDLLGIPHDDRVIESLDLKLKRGEPVIYTCTKLVPLKSQAKES